MRALDQEARAGLRALGVRFGAYHIYVPALLKPAPSALLATFWALKNGGLDTPGLADLPRLAASGRTSVPVDPAVPRALYRVVGYRLAGTRAVRIDILERLADLIRPLIAWRPTPEAPTPPDGAIDGYGFTVTVADDLAARLLGRGLRLGADARSATAWSAARRRRRPPRRDTGRGRTPERRSAGRSRERTAEAEPAGEPSPRPHGNDRQRPRKAPRLPPLTAGCRGTVDEAPSELPAAERCGRGRHRPTRRLPRSRRRRGGRRRGTPEPPKRRPPRRTAPADGEAPARGGSRRPETPRRGPGRTRLHRGLAARPAGAPGRPPATSTGANAERAANRARRGRGQRRRKPPTPRRRRTASRGRSASRNRRKGKSGKPRAATTARIGRTGRRPAAIAAERAATAPRRRPQRRPERDEKAADPNSPFAALAALKARLEGARGETTEPRAWPARSASASTSGCGSPGW